MKEYTDINELLPKDKHDDSTAEKLMALTDDEISVIMPVLLTWLQDVNWPVSSVIEDVIGKHIRAAAPYIPDILRGTDDMWKYGVVSRVLVKYPVNDKGIISEIKRLADSPTPSEEEEGVRDAAIKAMKAMESMI